MESPIRGRICWSMYKMNKEPVQDHYQEQRDTHRSSHDAQDTSLCDDTQMDPSTKADPESYA